MESSASKNDPHIKSSTEKPLTADPNYVDPNSSRIRNSGAQISYLPNKKFTIFLFTLFLITVIAALVITNNNTKTARESIRSKQLLIPTPST